MKVSPDLNRADVTESVKRNVFARASEMRQ